MSPPESTRPGRARKQPENLKTGLEPSLPNAHEIPKDGGGLIHPGGEIRLGHQGVGRSDQGGGKDTEGTRDGVSEGRLLTAGRQLCTQPEVYAGTRGFSEISVFIGAGEAQPNHYPPPPTPIPEAQKGCGWFPSTFLVCQAPQFCARFQV